MNEFEGVANTLFIPLVARINISKKFPEYFLDSKALELEDSLPESASKGSFEYSDISSAARCYNMDKIVTVFAGRQRSCNVVYLGAGLETAYDRLRGRLTDVNWYQVDLPEVIEARKLVFGQREKETLIASDMFEMKWIKAIQSSLPTMLVVSGVFHYYHEEDVVGFIKRCEELLPESHMVFDTISESGLRFTNWFIRRTGNADSVMHFGVNDSNTFAEKCGVKLVEELTFFTDALRIIGRRVGFVTRLFMKIAERRKQVTILHLKLS